MRRYIGAKQLLALALLAEQAVWSAGTLPVPATGVYLGIWANPALGPNQESAIEIREGPGASGIGRPFALHLHYYAWSDLSQELDSAGVFQPDQQLLGDISHGRVPVISWVCDTKIANSNHVIAGGDSTEDAVITATARVLAQYPGPVLLRWFWEFNVLGNNQSCRGDSGGKPTQQVYNDFIGTWQRIWRLFQSAGATNVAFLWNPGHYNTTGEADDPHGFYPGNNYVDWIGLDTYQRTTTATFDDDFGLFYSDFGGNQYGNKPLMAGENGSQGFAQNNTELQRTYLQGLLSDVQANRYPLLKAYDYFDSPGNGNWVLDDNNGQGNGGLAAFAALGASQSFSAIPGPAPPAFSAASIQNVWSGLGGGVSPGEVIAIYGSGLGPQTAATALLTPDNSRYSTSAGGTQVLFDSIAAPMIFSQDGVVSLVVPYEIAGKASTQVQISYKGQTSPMVAVPVVKAAPAILTAGITGSGQAKFFNQDLTLNSPTNPAAVNSIITLYLTGEGLTNPATDGLINIASFPNLTLPVTATIGGLDAKVNYKSEAPDLISGAAVIQLVVPNLPTACSVPLVLTIGGTNSQPGVTMCIQGAPPPPSVTFYVAPNGNDSWSGTLAASNAAKTDGPFATFDHARAVVQSLNKAGLGQVVVQFRAGTYFLPATVQFTAADSGTSNTEIVYANYPGESPVISGGVRIQNWTNVSGNTWKATLPASTQYFQNLFYNGVRRLRPRLGGSLGTYYRYIGPIYLNTSGPPAKTTDPNCPVYFAGSGWECYDRFQYAATDPIANTWKNLAPAAGNRCGQPAGNPALAGDIELVNFEQYSVSKLRFSCVDTLNHIAYLTGVTATEADHPNSHGFIADHRYLVENVQDQLTQPGQWFLDRSTTPWTLTYLANPGENPNTDTVIVPQLTQILVASNLRYVNFQGLTFAHDNYTMPATGYNGSSEIIASVSFQNSQHITFDSSTVTQTSGVGLEFISCIDRTSPNWCVSFNASGVTSNNLIENSAFYELAADALRIGTSGSPTDTNANVPQFHTVQNNVVEGYGRVYPSSKGITQGQGHDNLYTHNDIYDGYKGAIHVCYCANSDVNPPFTNNNIISFNHVYNLFQGLMNDSGSLYFGVGTPSPPSSGSGNKMLNNKVHDVSDASVWDSDGYGGDGLYADDFSGLVDMENNLVYRVSGNAISFSGPRAGPNQSSTVKNNIVAFARQSMLNSYDPYSFNSVPPLPQFFAAENNLFYFDRNAAQSFYPQGGCTYAGEVFPAYQQWTSNLYWRTDAAFASDPKAFHVQQSLDASGGCGNQKLWTYYTFSGWQGLSEDVHGVVQNPGFKNPAYPADDYSLPNGSPGVGFVVFDPNQAGRTNPAIKPPAVPATFPTKTFNPATDF